MFVIQIFKRTLGNLTLKIQIMAALDLLSDIGWGSFVVLLLN